MNRFRMCLVVSVLALAASLAGTSGCSRQDAGKILAPAPRPDPSIIHEAHWITSVDELRGLTARAGKSPLMARAISDEAQDPDLEKHTGGVVGVMATTVTGDRIRVTMIPYQFRSDADHARYFVLNELNGASRVETFDLLRRKPKAGEDGFLPVNGAIHGLWIRSGSTYAQDVSRSGHLAPERFNLAKFGACFAAAGDMVAGAVDAACGAMGNWPGCRAIGNSVGLAGAAAYCGWLAYNG